MLSRRLKYFLGIADAHSISAASHLFHVSQSALTRQVRLLEESVGCQLFDRNRRGVDLTEAGSALYTASQKLKREAELATRTVASLAGAERTQLKIEVEPSIVCSDIFISKLNTFRNTHPDIRLSTTIASSESSIQNIISGAADVAFAYVGELHPVHDATVHPWLASNFAILVNRESSLASRDVVSLSDLENRSVMVLKNPDLIEYVRSHFPAIGGGDIAKRFRNTHSSAVAISHVAIGIGCCICLDSWRYTLPKQVVSKPIRELQHLPTTKYISLVTSRSKAKEDALRLIDSFRHANAPVVPGPI